MSVLGVVALAALSAAAAAAGDCNAPQARAGGGELLGAARLSSTGARVRAFEGVPYGRAARFRRPEPAAPPRRLMARAPPLPCRQAGGGAEACLSLNVYAPHRDCTGAPLPVLVFIHGGSLTAGSAYGDGLTDGVELAAKGHMVVVSIQYRLGLFGFGHMPGGDANPGLWDQQLALEWVHENIEAFGGDPARVTISGESAGAWSVCFQLVNPRARGLFQQAIIMSGGCISTADPAGRALQPAEAIAEGRALAVAAGCDAAADDDELARCVHELDAEAIVAATPPVVQPTIDEKNNGVFRDFPRRLLERGEIDPRVRVLIGTMRDEHTFLIDNPLSAFPLAAGVRDAYPAEMSAAIVAQYESLGTAKFLGDLAIKCPSMASAARLAPHVPTFNYRIDHALSMNVFAPGAPYNGELGAYHASDLAMLFGTFDAALSPADLEVSADVREKFITFIHGNEPFPPMRGIADRTYVFDVPERCVLEFNGVDFPTCETIIAATDSVMNADYRKRMAEMIARRDYRIAVEDDDDSDDDDDDDDSSTQTVGSSTSSLTTEDSTLLTLKGFDDDDEADDDDDDTSDDDDDDANSASSSSHSTQYVGSASSSSSSSHSGKTYKLPKRKN